MIEGKRNIVLTGFMATGKSSVGRRLAIALGYDFLDLDTLIAAEAGMPTTSPADASEITRFVRYDKKIQGGLIRYVLLRGIGDATVVSLESLTELETALMKCA